LTSHPVGPFSPAWRALRARTPSQASFHYPHPGTPLLQDLAWCADDSLVTCGAPVELKPALLALKKRSLEGKLLSDACLPYVRGGWEGAAEGGTGTTAAGAGAGGGSEGGSGATVGRQRGRHSGRQ
jgi:hypothetical protein